LRLGVIIQLAPEAPDVQLLELGDASKLVHERADVPEDALDLLEVGGIKHGSPLST